MLNYDIKKDIEIAKEIMNINDSQMASLMQVSRSTLNNWKNRTSKISSVYLEKLYSFFYSNRVFLNKLYEQSLKDSQSKNRIILFHGAKKNITETVSLDYSAENNDFGKGFYLGDNFLQSASFIANYPAGSVYIGELTLDKNLKTIEYSVNNEWMLTIAYFRGKLSDYNNSKYLKDIISEINGTDLVIAPIADNRMFRIIDEFIEGNITDLQCKSALSATDLGKQYVLLTERALSHFKVIRHCYICQEEKDDYLTRKNEFNLVSNQKVKFVKREFAGKGKYIEELLV